MLLNVLKSKLVPVFFKRHVARRFSGCSSGQSNRTRKWDFISRRGLWETCYTIHILKIILLLSILLLFIYLFITTLFVIINTKRLPFREELNPHVRWPLKISTKLLRKYKSDKDYYSVRRNVKDITKIYPLIMELLKLSNYQIRYAIATILCSLRTS